MQTLEALLNSVATHSKPQVWSEKASLIEQEYSHLAALLAKGDVKVYGANTLTGHRDGEQLSSDKVLAFQKEILSTHCIGSGVPYSEHAARCISAAKVFSWSAGMSGVSPTLYNLMGNLTCQAEFYPTVPSGCSYSSGDVIPASHWAVEMLNELESKYQYEIKPGEVMALINGAFVHVGYSASLVNKCHTAWVLFLEATALMHTVTMANTSNLQVQHPATNPWAQSSLEHIRSIAPKADSVKDVQDPVSLRAIPQVVDTLCRSFEDYFNEINSLLASPSGNPLFSTQSDTQLSQASFIAPGLSIKTGALIESVLFAMWSMLGRTNHLLSGNVANIAKDGAHADSPLALIQYPKLMMATLEDARMRCGRKVFASGSQTSYGIEDLWSNGVSVTRQLDELLDSFIALSQNELHIINYLKQYSGAAQIPENAILNIAKHSESIQALATNVEQIISSNKTTLANDGFPIKR